MALIDAKRRIEMDRSAVLLCINDYHTAVESAKRLHKAVPANTQLFETYIHALFREGAYCTIADLVAEVMEAERRNDQTEAYPRMDGLRDIWDEMACVLRLSRDQKCRLHHDDRTCSTGIARTTSDALIASIVRQALVSSTSLARPWAFTSTVRFIYHYADSLNVIMEILEPILGLDRASQGIATSLNLSWSGSWVAIDILSEIYLNETINILRLDSEDSRVEPAISWEPWISKLTALSVASADDIGGASERSRAALRLGIWQRNLGKTLENEWERHLMAPVHLALERLSNKDHTGGMFALADLAELLFNAGDKAKDDGSNGNCTQATSSQSRS